MLTSAAATSFDLSLSPPLSAAASAPLFLFLLLRRSISSTAAAALKSSHSKASRHLRTPCPFASSPLPPAAKNLVASRIRCRMAKNSSTWSSVTSSSSSFLNRRRVRLSSSPPSKSDRFFDAIASNLCFSPPSLFAETRRTNSNWTVAGFGRRKYLGVMTRHAWRQPHGITRDIFLFDRLDRQVNLIL